MSSSENILQWFNVSDIHEGIITQLSDDYLEDVGGRIELGVVASAHSTKYAIRNAKRRVRRRHVRTDLR